MRVPMILSCALLLGGCPAAPPGDNAGGTVPSPGPAAVTTAPAGGETGTATRPATPPGPQAVMATVNGQPIYMDQLITPLVEGRGLEIARMLIDDLLVEQEARRAGLAVTDAEVLAENDLTLKLALQGQDLSADERQRLLTRLLARRGLTQELWDSTMRRNALLRKMAEPRVTVPEAGIRAEFAARYGQKVEISHIRVPTLSEAQKVLEELKKGADFGRLARQRSTDVETAEKNGAYPLFSRDSTFVPQAIRDAAFQLTPGQVSGPVKVGEDYHVLKCQQFIPAPDVKYEIVKDALAKELRERFVSQVQAEILLELRRKSQVEFVQPQLRRAAQAGGG